jgi:hypothetical protein
MAPTAALPVKDEAWSRRLLALAGRRPAAIADCVAAGFYFTYYVSRFHVGTVWPLTPRGDASILYAFAKAIFARGAYAPVEIFPYPPSAVLLFAGLGAAGPAVFAALWFLLMAAGLAVSVRAGLVQERAALRSAWPLLGAVAVLLANGPIGWDLRNGNSNLVYLGLTMAGFGLLGRRPLLAGVLVALSISLKLYSGVLLVWLLVNGPRRTLAGAVLGVLALWLGLPALIFGISGAEHLYAGWGDQVRFISAPATQAAFAARGTGAPIVTLQKAIVDVTGLGFGSPATLAWLHGLWAVWIAALLGYAWRWRRSFPVGAPSRGALADWVVVLLAPLPVSPWLEPYHAVPILMGALLLTIVAADADQPGRDRIAAAASLAVLAVFATVNVPFAFRGFALFAQFLTLVIALAVVRPSLEDQSAGDGAH